MFCCFFWCVDSAFYHLNPRVRDLFCLLSIVVITMCIDCTLCKWDWVWVCCVNFIHLCFPLIFNCPNKGKQYSTCICVCVQEVVFFFCWRSTQKEEKELLCKKNSSSSNNKRPTIKCTLTFAERFIHFSVHVHLFIVQQQHKIYCSTQLFIFHSIFILLFFCE